MKAVKLIFLISFLSLLSISSEAQVWFNIDSIYVDSQFTTLDNIPISVSGQIASHDYGAKVTSIIIERDTVFIFVEFKFGIDTVAYFWRVDCDLAPLPVGNYVVTCTAQPEGPPYYAFYHYNYFKVVAPSGIFVKENTIKNYSLLNFPNPASNSTIIKFNNDSNDYYDLVVYNATGVEVRSIKKIWFDKGENSIPLDLTNLSNGIYIYVLKNNKFLQTSKMVVRK